MSNWVKGPQGDPRWEFEPQGSKYGYINNPNWAFPATPTHLPCGYWPKGDGGGGDGGGGGGGAEPPSDIGTRFFYSVTESCYLLRFNPLTGETDFTYLVEGDTFAVGSYVTQAFGTDSNGEFKIVSTALKLHEGLANPDAILSNFMVFDESFQQTLKQDYDWTEGAGEYEVLSSAQTFRFENSNEVIIVARYTVDINSDGVVKIYKLNILTGDVTLLHTIAYSATLGRFSYVAQAGDHVYILYWKGCIDYTVSTNTYTTLFTITPPDTYHYLWQVFPYSTDRLLVLYYYSSSTEYRVYDRSGNYLHSLTNLGTQGSYDPHLFFKMPPDATKAVYYNDSANTWVLYDLINETILTTIPTPTVTESSSFGYYDSVTDRIFIQFRENQTVTAVAQQESYICCYDSAGTLLYTTDVLWPIQDYLVDWVAHTPTTDRTEPKYTNQLLNVSRVPSYISSGWSVFTDGVNVYSAYVIKDYGYYPGKAGLWVRNATTGESILEAYVPISTTLNDTSMEQAAGAAGPYIVVPGWGSNADFIVTLKNGVITGDTSIFTYMDNDSINISDSTACRLHYNESEKKLWLLIDGWDYGASSACFYVFESIDDGATWTQLEKFTYTAYYANQQSCYFFTYGGIVHIGIAGSAAMSVYAYNVLTGRFDFVRSKTGLTQYNYMYCNDDAIYYSTQTGTTPRYHTFYKSTDLMQNWTTLGQHPYPTGYTWDSYPFAVKNQLIIASIARPATFAYPWNLMLVSSDEGATWTEIGPQGKDYSMEVLYVNGTFYTFGSLWNDLTEGDWSRGPVYKTTDGVTWIECMEDFVTKFAYLSYQIALKPAPEVPTPTTITNSPIWRL